MKLRLAPTATPPLVFAGLALLVLGLLLLPGYILTFDMSWTPHLPAPAVGNNNASLFFGLLHVLNLIIASDILQKLVLFLMFWLLGWGAFRLVRIQLSAPAAYLAGTFAVVNPFVYTRLMAGHYLVLLGLACLPWALHSLWRLLERPGWRPTLSLAAWSSALALVSIHLIAMAALMSVAAMVAWGWGRWPRLKPALRWLAIAAGLWLMVNAYWLAPLISGGSQQAHQIAGFNQAQAEAFATSSAAGLPLPVTVLVLEGFWADPIGRYVLPSSTGWLFGLAAVVLGALALGGLVAAWRRRDRLAIALAVVGLVAWWLAIGIAWPPTAGMASWLAEHVPFYRGYREPQKWAAVLVLTDAYLIGVGLDALRRHWRHRETQALELGALLIPLALTPMLLWGAGGQLRSVAYPASWADLNQLLVAGGSEPVLVLPWHEYLAISFAGRVVANPAANYFSVPVVTSQNPEMPGVPDEGGRTGRSSQVEDTVLAYRTLDDQTAARLRRLGLRRVVVLKEADWPDSATWLSSQAGLSLVAETPGWQLWQVGEQP